MDVDFGEQGEAWKLGRQGSGEGDLRELSPPSSPRLRQTTFGATLDFIEALCDASAGLTSFAPVCVLCRLHLLVPQDPPITLLSMQEDREWALRRGLEEINKEIEAASRMGVACWFPMGTGDVRIVRLAAREAILLNSRDKAPFMLLVEVLSAAEVEPMLEPDRLIARLDSNAAAGPGERVVSCHLWGCSNTVFLA